MDYEKAFNDIMRDIDIAIAGQKEGETKIVLQNLKERNTESEDERIRKFLIAHVTDWIGCIEHDLKLSSKDVESEEELAMFKAGLAYLEKQKEQKPEEWSEEDEEMVDYAYGLCYNAHETAHSAQDANKATKCMSWLKSLHPHPHWKPSEEQMKVLKGAILYVESCESNFEYSGLPLEMLYEDLEKLH